MSKVKFAMRLIQGRITPQGAFCEFVSAEDGTHRETYLKTTIAPDELETLDFGKRYKLTLEAEEVGEGDDVQGVQ